MSFNVELSDLEIEKMFKAVVTGPNKELVAEALYAMLKDDPNKVQSIVRAVVGAVPEQFYFADDEVLVQYEAVPKWQMSKSNMEEAGMINNGMIKATLVEFKKFEPASYTVRFKYIDDDGNEKTSVYSVTLEQMQIGEEFPEDDLPF